MKVWNHHTRNIYIDPPHHNLENCLLPCFVPQSCMNQASSQWPHQAVVREKTWKETIFKIMVGRINVSISSVVIMHL